MMMSGIERDAAKPKCGRCHKDVDSAKRTPIVNASEVIGWRLTYKCHGEEKSLDVLASWFAEPGNETRPFLENVFEPVAVAVPTVAEALKDDLTVKMRDKAMAVRKFMGDTIRSIIESQVDFDGDHAAWASQHKMLVATQAQDFVDVNDVEFRVLMIDDMKPLGTFTIPLFLDAIPPQWTPYQRGRIRRVMSQRPKKKPKAV